MADWIYWALITFYVVLACVEATSGRVWLGLYWVGAFTLTVSLWMGR